MTPAEQHAYDAGRFAALTRSASAADWDRPSPVQEWVARDVVGHLVGWLPGLLGAGGVSLPEIAPEELAADPAAAWTRRAADVQTLLEERGAEPFSHPMIGEMPLGQAVAQFYVNDVWMHSWDLARALGLDLDLGEERCAAALVGMAAMDDLLRSSGQFGPQIGVPDDASAQDRLIGFIGRDPAWQAPDGTVPRD